jgi:hypothetical protein
MIRSLMLFIYISFHDSSTMVFDDGYLQWNDSDFQDFDWSEFYHDAKEDIPWDASTLRGHAMKINVFVNARNKTEDPT